MSTSILTFPTHFRPAVVLLTGFGVSVFMQTGSYVCHSFDGAKLIITSSSQLPNALGPADKDAAKSLVECFLPLTWDFDSTTANQSQQQALSYMTQDCAKVYKLNIWPSEIAEAVAAANMTSSFTVTSCDAICSTEDGNVVVKIIGHQIVNVPDQRPLQKLVEMEYLVAKTPTGLRISGISQSGTFAR